MVGAVQVGNQRPDHDDHRCRHAGAYPRFEVSVVGRNTRGVTLIRTAEDENVVGLQRAWPSRWKTKSWTARTGAEAVEEDTTPLDDGDDAAEPMDDDNNVCSSEGVGMPTP